MNERFFITQIRICTFTRTGEKTILPNYEYPERICVVDNESKVAIDILDEIQYDYIETINMRHFKNKSNERIKDNKRAAIFPVRLLSIDDEYLKKAVKIVKKIQSGYRFLDGNAVYNNDEYLQHIQIQQEQLEKKASKQKTKKLWYFTSLE